jgi:hypothetical protein
MNYLRLVIILFTHWTPWHKKLLQRCDLLEIGFSGHVSDLERSAARDKGFKPLNCFERWLLKPAIEVERRHRQQDWTQTIRDILGE